MIFWKWFCYTYTFTPVSGTRLPICNLLIGQGAWALDFSLSQNCKLVWTRTDIALLLSKKWELHCVSKVWLSLSFCMNVPNSYDLASKAHLFNAGKCLNPNFPSRPVTLTLLLLCASFIAPLLRIIHGLLPFCFVFECKFSTLVIIYKM